MVDTVWNPATPDDFPGLYCTALPDQPFLPGGHTLLLTSQWRRWALFGCDSCHCVSQSEDGWMVFPDGNDRVS